MAGKSNLMGQPHGYEEDGMPFDEGTGYGDVVTPGVQSPKAVRAKEPGEATASGTEIDDKKPLERKVP